jgi:uncharacterized protein YcbK (DUF882 family)
LTTLGSGRSAAAPGALRWARLARRALFGATALAALAAGTSGTQDAVANGDTRTIHLYHEHTKESGSITFKRNGYYDQSALEKLNWLLRDWRTDEKVRMEPRLFDILWEVYRSVGASEPVHVVSAYRSPGTNAMLRRRSRAVSEYSQHMAGRAMDFYLPGVDMHRVRATAMRLQHGGVGFYPHSAHQFVHLDAGSVRAWPRMTRGQLMALFPDGKTVHLPRDNKPLARYEEARAEVLARGGTVAGLTSYAALDDSGGRRRSLWATLFGGGDEDEDYYGSQRGRGRGRAAATQVAAYSNPNAEDAGTRGVMAFAAAEPAWNRGRPAPAAEPSPPAVTAAISPPAEAAPAALAAAPLPPKRPDDFAEFAALAYAPMPPARPVELASAMMIPAATRTDAGAGAGFVKDPSDAPAAAPRLSPDDRVQLRALFAAAASGATPEPRVKVATARAKPRNDAPGGLVSAPSAGLAMGFSGRPGDLAGNRFTGPAIKALPVLR